MQYLGYCTVCNTSNPSRSFNPTVPYLDTSPVQAGNPCALLFSFQFPHFKLQNSSLVSLRVLCCSHFSFPILNFKTPFVSLTSTDFLSHTPSAPLSQHPRSLPLPQPRRHRFPLTRLRPIKKTKKKRHQRSRPPNTRLHHSLNIHALCLSLNPVIIASRIPDSDP